MNTIYFLIFFLIIFIIPVYFLLFLAPFHCLAMDIIGYVFVVVASLDFSDCA